MSNGKYVGFEWTHEGNRYELTIAIPDGRENERVYVDMLAKCKTKAQAHADRMGVLLTPVSRAVPAELQEFL